MFRGAFLILYSPGRSAYCVGCSTCTKACGACYPTLTLPTSHAGVNDLERSDPGEGQASKYALLISDTYLIEDGPPQQLTNMATRNWSEIAYFFSVRLSTLCTALASLRVFLHAHAHVPVLILQMACVFDNQLHHGHDVDAGPSSCTVRSFCCWAEVLPRRAMVKLCQCPFSAVCHLLHVSVQDEEEEAEPEQPAKKPVKEEAVFAGNKHLRSEDQKYREINDDRQVASTHAIDLSAGRFTAGATTACWRLACQDFPASMMAVAADTVFAQSLQHHFLYQSSEP